jgi:hypothetical protein
VLELPFILIQSLIVVILIIHDWVPLGRLNDLAGLKKQVSFKENLIITIVNSLPTLIALIISIVYFDQPYPLIVSVYLILLYFILFMGEIRAWWIPYFFGTTPERVKRYATMFGNTHSFLPERNGITPNTLHVILHLLTLIALILSIFVVVMK